MKTIFLISFSILISSLFADSVTNEEFPYIKPVSVERLTIIKEQLVDENLTQQQSKQELTKQTTPNDNSDAPDEDQDGVPDNLDACQNTAKEFNVDSSGCPQKTILKINFNSSGDTILKNSLQEIEWFADFLDQNSNYQVIIYAFADTKELSQKHAKSVMNNLVDYGIKLTRLTAIGMGTKNPIADTDTPEGRAKNTRIEMELIP